AFCGPVVPEVNIIEAIWFMSNKLSYVISLHPCCNVDILITDIAFKLIWLVATTVSTSIDDNWFCISSLVKRVFNIAISIPANHIAFINVIDSILFSMYKPIRLLSNFFNCCDNREAYLYMEAKVT